MRQVTPSGDFPPNVQLVRFTPPDNLPDGLQMQDAVGLAHLNEGREIVALEFMFELTDDEIQVLNHERYLTLTMMSDHLHPFALQTSYPPDPKYAQLDEHTHVCVDGLTHEKDKFWKCENPRHDHKQNRIRECEECWYERTQGDSDGGSLDSEETAG